MPIVINFEELFNNLMTDVLGLAQSTVKNYVNDAKKDAKKLLEDMKGDLKRWVELLVKGELTTAEFEWLVNSQKGTLKMEALKQSGLAAIRVDQFLSSVLNLIVDTSFSLLKI